MFFDKLNEITAALTKELTPEKEETQDRKHSHCCFVICTTNSVQPAVMQFVLRFGNGNRLSTPEYEGIWKLKFRIFKKRRKGDRSGWRMLPQLQLLRWRGREINWRIRENMFRCIGYLQITYEQKEHRQFRRWRPEALVGLDERDNQSKSTSNKATEQLHEKKTKSSNTLCYIVWCWDYILSHIYI